MADVNANINIGINSAQAVAGLRNLEAQISQFQKTVTSANSTAVSSWNRALVDSINATNLFNSKMVDSVDSARRFSDALDKSKLSLGQYVSYASSQMPGMSRVFRREFDTIQQVAETRVRAINSQYISLGKTIDGVTRAIKSTPTGIAEGYAGNLAVTAQRQQMLNKLIDDGSTKLLNWGKNTQWAGRQLMVGFTLPLAALGTVASQTFMEIDKASLSLRRVYGDLSTTTEEIDRNVDAIKSLGSEYSKYGIALSNTIEIAGRAAATGAQNETLMAATEQTLRFATLGQIDYNMALDSTISLQTAFGISNEDLAKKIDFLNAVENQTILTIEDMALAIPRVATVIKGLGGDVEDLAVMMTAMREGGVSAENAANALKSGLASLINPTKRATESMSAMGLNIKQIVDANKGDLMGLVKDFATATNALDEFSRQQVFEQVFGKYQYARMSALFTNITNDAGQAARAMELASRSAEELAAISEKELGAISETTSVKFQAAMEKLKISIAPLGEAFLKGITPIVELVTKIADAFNNLPDGVKNAIAVVTGLVGGLGPILLMTIGLVGNGIANIIKAVQFFRKSIARVKGDASAFEYMASAELEALVATERLEGGAVQLTGTLNLQKKAVDALTSSYMRFAEVAGIATGAMGSRPAPARGGRMPAPVKRNAGGTIPGVGNTDTVPAMLTPGEFVINKQSTKENLPLLHAINNGKISGFNRGGRVAMSRAHLGSRLATPQEAITLHETKMSTQSRQDRRMKVLSELASKGVPVWALTDDWALLSKTLNLAGRRRTTTPKTIREIIEDLESTRSSADVGPAMQRANISKKDFISGLIKKLQEKYGNNLDTQFTDQIFTEARDEIFGLVSSRVTGLRAPSQIDLLPWAGATSYSDPALISKLDEAGFELIPPTRKRGKYKLRSKTTGIKVEMGASTSFNRGGLVPGVQYKINGGQIQRLMRSSLKPGELERYLRGNNQFDDLTEEQVKLVRGFDSQSQSIGKAPIIPNVDELFKSGATFDSIEKIFSLRPQRTTSLAGPASKEQIEKWLAKNSNISFADLQNMYSNNPMDDETRKWFLREIIEKRFMNPDFRFAKGGQVPGVQYFGWNPVAGIMNKQRVVQQTKLNSLTGAVKKLQTSGFESLSSGEKAIIASAATPYTGTLYKGVSRPSPALSNDLRKSIETGTLQSGQLYPMPAGSHSTNESYATMFAANETRESKALRELDFQINSEIPLDKRKLASTYTDDEIIDIVKKSKEDKINHLQKLLDLSKRSGGNTSRIKSQEEEIAMLTSLDPISKLTSNLQKRKDLISKGYGDNIVLTTQTGFNDVPDGMMKIISSERGKDGILRINAQVGKISSVDVSKIAPNTKLGGENLTLNESEQFIPNSFFNKGGFIFANNGVMVPGTGNKDTVPAMLTPGEFVVNKKATQSNLALLHAINDGSVKGFQDGGDTQSRKVRYSDTKSLFAKLMEITNIREREAYIKQTAREVAGARAGAAATGKLAQVDFAHRESIGPESKMGRENWRLGKSGLPQSSFLNQMTQTYRSSEKNRKVFERILKAQIQNNKITEINGKQLKFDQNAQKRLLEKLEKGQTLSAKEQRIANEVNKEIIKQVQARTIQPQEISKNFESVLKGSVASYNASQEWERQYRAADPSQQRRMRMQGLSRIRRQNRPVGMRTPAATTMPIIRNASVNQAVNEVTNMTRRQMQEIIDEKVRQNVSKMERTGTLQERVAQYKQQKETERRRIGPRMMKEMRGETGQTGRAISQSIAAERNRLMQQYGLSNEEATRHARASVLQGKEYVPSSRRSGGKLAGRMMGFGGAIGSAGMGLGMASMIPFMAQNQEGKFMGMDANALGMGLMGASIALPMAGAGVKAAAGSISAAGGLGAALASNPVGWGIAGVAAAAAALAGGLYLWRKSVDDANRETAKLASNIGGTANSLNTISQLFGEKTPVGRIAQMQIGPVSRQQEEQISQFQNVFQSEGGQQFIKDLENATSADRFKKLSDYLKNAVASGLMDQQMAQSFAKAVGLQLNDVVLSNSIIKSLAGQKTGSVAMLDLARSRGTAIAGAGNIAALQNEKNVDSKIASAVIGSSIQVIQDFANAAALAKEEFISGKISYSAYKKVIDESTASQEKYTNAINDAFNKTNDFGGTMQAWKDQLTLTGLNENAISAIETATTVAEIAGPGKAISPQSVEGFRASKTLQQQGIDTATLRSAATNAILGGMNPAQVAAISEAIKISGSRASKTFAETKDFGLAGIALNLSAGNVAGLENVPQKTGPNRIDPYYNVRRREIEAGRNAYIQAATNFQKAGFSEADFQQIMSLAESKNVAKFAIEFSGMKENEIATVISQTSKLNELIGPEGSTKLLNILINEDPPNIDQKLPDLTKKLTFIVENIPDDIQKRLGISLYSPYDIEQWGNLALEIGKLVPLIDQLPEGLRQFGIDLIMKSGGEVKDPQTFIDDVNKMQKSYGKLSSKNKNVKKQAILEFLTMAKDSKGNKIENPEKAYNDMVRYIESEFGKGTFNQLPPDTYTKVISIQSEIVGLQQEVEKQKLLAQINKGGLSPDSFERIFKRIAELQGEQSKAVMAGLTVEAPTTGGGGGGGINALLELKKQILNAYKMYVDLEATMKLFNNKKKSFIDLLIEAGSIGNLQGGLQQLFRIPGLDTSLMEQLGSLAPKDLQKWLNKYTKDGKLNPAGKIISEISKATQIGSITKEAEVARRKNAETRIAKSVVASQGRSVDLQNYFAESPEAASILLDLRKKIGVAKTKKEKVRATRIYTDFLNTIEEGLRTDVFEQELNKLDVQVKQLQADIDKISAGLTAKSEATFEQQYGMTKKQAEIEIMRNQMKIKQYQREIDVIQKRNSVIQHEIDLLEYSKKPIQNKINLIQKEIDQYQKSVDAYQREIDLRNQVADVLNHDLDLISQQEEEINKAYDERVAALDKVQQLNQQIIDQQQSQLNISNALSQGDIFAAAQAQQQMRASQSQYAMEQMRAGFTGARDQQVAGLTGVGGMTRVQIEQQLKMINDQNYQTQLSITDLQNKIYDKNLLIIPLREQIASIDEVIAGRQEQIWQNNQAIYEIQQNSIEPLQQIVEGWQQRLDDSKEQLDLDIASATLNQVAQIEILDLQEKNIKATQANIEAANALGEAYEGVARQLLTINRLLKSRSDDIAIDKYVPKKTPSGYIFVNAKNQTREQAMKELNEWYKSQVDSIMKNIPLPGAFAGGMIKRFAAGNMVLGNGTRDSVPALLAPGEFVMRKAAVDKYGPAMFQRMNMGAFDVPKYDIPQLSNTNISPITTNTNVVAPVYNNYSVNVPVTQPNASADEIAHKVITKIRNIESMSVRSFRGY